MAFFPRNVDQFIYYLKKNVISILFINIYCIHFQSMVHFYKKITIFTIFIKDFFFGYKFY